MNDELVARLKALLGAERVITDRNDLVAYCMDYGKTVSCFDQGVWPLCAVLPESTEEVVGIVRLAIEHRAPVVPRGGGSNQVGGVLPPEGAVVLSVARMNRILDIDPVNMTVTAQPGVTLKEMDERLRPYGLTLSQAQGSYRLAHIGGAVSTNGFSQKHSRYGNIGDNVLSLEAVLGTGAVLRTGRGVGPNSAGYQLHKLFVGAEGTLGVVTELTLKVGPLPEADGSVSASFGSWRSLKEASIAVMRSGLNYTGGFCCQSRHEDGSFSDFLMLGFEGLREEVDAQVRTARRLLIELGGELHPEERSDELWNNWKMYWCGSVAPEGRYYDDLVSVMPLQSYDAAHERIEHEIFPKYGIRFREEEYRLIVLGKRPLVVFSFLLELEKDSKAKLERAFGDMMRIVAEHGGVGPGCHAVGSLLRNHLGVDFEPVALDMMRSIKRLFDPHNIMNPDKKLPPE